MEFQETNGIARTASTMLEMLYLPPPHVHRFRNAFYAPRKVEPWNELLTVVYSLLFSFSTVSVGSCLLCIVDPWGYASSLSLRISVVFFLDPDGRDMINIFKIAERRWTYVCCRFELKTWLLEMHLLSQDGGMLRWMQWTKMHCQIPCDLWNWA